MARVVMMRGWIRRVQGGEKMKDQDVDEAHGKNGSLFQRWGAAC